MEQFLNRLNENTFSSTELLKEFNIRTNKKDTQLNEVNFIELVNKITLYNTLKAHNIERNLITVEYDEVDFKVIEGKVFINSKHFTNQYFLTSFFLQLFLF
ncbi:hypothetical protein QO206_13150 [Leeuwenhoekiella aequorea]|uniref:hypothetical protein n=1 Tax=Leeuwenhoekiella aequorea TaxID=283736 RepID=UPI00352FE841|tara:strand:+ start:2978 stop:3280 length:303 start_codon:yes stop_codon:yes gene_type:complete